MTLPIRKLHIGCKRDIALSLKVGHEDMYSNEVQHHILNFRLFYIIWEGWPYTSIKKKERRKL